MGLLQIVSDVVLIANNGQKQLQSEKFCDCIKFGSCEGLAIVRVRMLWYRKSLRICKVLWFATARFQKHLSLLFAMIFGSQNSPMLLQCQMQILSCSSFLYHKLQWVNLLCYAQTLIYVKNGDSSQCSQPSYYRWKVLGVCQGDQKVDCRGCGLHA